MRRLAAALLLVLALAHPAAAQKKWPPERLENLKVLPESIPVRALVDTVHEAASLGVLDRDEVVFIERYQERLADLGVDIRVGSRVPAYCSSIGYWLLAFLPRDAARRVLEMSRRVKINENTPVALDEIEEQLAVVRELGYAISDSTFVAGLRVLAAPILGADGNAVAAISVP